MPQGEATCGKPDTDLGLLRTGFCAVAPSPWSGLARLFAHGLKFGSTRRGQELSQINRLTVSRFFSPSLSTTDFLTLKCGLPERGSHIPQLS